MPTETSLFPAALDGRAVDAADLSPLAFAGFAHFTAIQVRDRKIRGLDLHLKRLHNASLDFFGRALPEDLLRSRIRQAVNAGPPDQSLAVTIFSPKGEFTADSMQGDLSVLVRGGPPSNGPKGPLRLAVVEHERPHATIKHVGESGKTYYLHQAIRAGFDDAAFINRQGRLSEASIWNLVFWDGEAVIWPKAEMLTGTMMGTVQRQLERLGVPQRQEEITLERLETLSGAAVMNSWTPGIAVSAIGSMAFPDARAFMDLLHRAHAAEPAEHV
ncbi:MAG TPA: aminotransferase class IV family protein [Ensifer sp.]|uniref:aminotransferase class IV family protein n=1 Tax=Ensifer sp. TaxID=1872086 RepID=UPI002E1049A4|nr:aminotransferase class IV family protein [Ensifer sp.]